MIVRFLCLLSILISVLIAQNIDYEGKVVKGTRNALYLVQNGKRRIFPDFYTFSKKGFNVEAVVKIKDEALSNMPLGDPVEAIPVFRPEDYMYHSQCEDPERMANDLGVVANLGDLMRFATVYQRVRQRRGVDLLLLGGSITAGGYFLEFTNKLSKSEGFNVSIHNHGHGATDIPYTIYCIDIARYAPDLVLIDFSVNDYTHPKFMDNLIRKALSLPSRPVVVLVNLWVEKHCPQTRYLLHSYYYQLPLLNLCPAIDLCYGKGHLPRHITDLYSKTDGVHPWGSEGVRFIGDLLFAWWKRLENILTNDVQMETNGRTTKQKHSYDKLLHSNQAEGREVALPPPLYVSNPIGLCTRCAALADDADGKLVPVLPPKGFRAITRIKVGFGGFRTDGAAPTKSSRKSWQANEVGSEITFRFYGSSVEVAVWQRRDGMGVLYAFIDDNRNRIAKATGFFKGYTWAMERNNTGRSMIVPLFEGLTDTYHNITFVVSDEPANPWVKGHLTQIFALLSASDDLKCKSYIS